MSSFSYYPSSYSSDGYYRQAPTTSPIFNRMPVINNRYTNRYTYDNSRPNYTNEELIDDYDSLYGFNGVQKDSLILTKQPNLDPLNIKELDELEKIVRKIKYNQSNFINIPISNYEYLSIYPNLLSKIRRELKLLSPKTLKMELSVEKEEEFPLTHKIITQNVRAKCGPSGKIIYKIRIKSTIPPINSRNIIIKLTDRYVEIYRQSSTEEEISNNRPKSTSAISKNETLVSLYRQEKINATTKSTNPEINIPKIEAPTNLANNKQELSAEDQAYNLEVGTDISKSENNKSIEEVRDVEVKDDGFRLLAEPDDIDKDKSLITEFKADQTADEPKQQAATPTHEKSISIIDNTVVQQKIVAEKPPKPVYNLVRSKSKEDRKVITKKLDKKSQTKQSKQNLVQRSKSAVPSRSKKQQEKDLQQAKLSSSSLHSINPEIFNKEEAQETVLVSLLKEPNDLFESSIIAEYDQLQEYTPRPRRLSRTFSMSLEKISENSDSQPDDTLQVGLSILPSLLQEPEYFRKESPSFEELESLCQNDMIDDNTLNSLIGGSQSFELFNTKRASIEQKEFNKPKSILNLIGADDDDDSYIEPKREELIPLNHNNKTNGSIPNSNTDDTRFKIDRIMEDFDTIISKFETCYSKSSSLNKIDTIKELKDQSVYKTNDIDTKSKKEFLISSIENLCKPSEKAISIRDSNHKNFEMTQKIAKKPIDSIQTEETKPKKSELSHNSRGRDRKSPSPRSLSYSRYLYLIKM